MKHELSRHMFEKCKNSKFHENSATGSRVVPSGRTKDMTKLIVTLSNFGNAPKNEPFTEPYHTKCR